MTEIKTALVLEDQLRRDWNGLHSKGIHSPFRGHNVYNSKCYPLELEKTTTFS